MEFRIATFNANSIRSRMEIILAWLDRHRPDVLCVQETKVQDVEFPKTPFLDNGYTCAFKGEKKYNGVAILSRHPLTKVFAGLDDEPKDPARLIRADIRGLTVVTTYIPQGQDPLSDKFTYKLQWFQRLGRYFESHFAPTDRVVWMGDMNVAMEDKDVYDPAGLRGHVCFCPEVQQSMSKLVEWGWVDLFRKHCPDPGQYTFWDYRMNALRRNLGWRLDYIFATRPVAERCMACRIDKEPRMLESPSDHTFLMADLDF
ncbi:MAG: exodeoxyribonuclease III [Phycisphaerae bacterium]|nr:exodeoxyribonuclease III [Phycisphaerae bacterium]